MKTKIHKIRIKDIKVFGGRRSVQSDKVRLIADSMNKIGLKTPITVKKCKTGVRLVAGLHRLKAAELLGWKKIDAVQMSGSKTDAGLWEDSENLHRAEMKVLERSVKINRWRRHFLKVAKAAQVAGPGGRQPNDAAISVTAKKLGFKRDEISRAKLIAGIAPKVQAKLLEYGLDDDQAALLAIAKAPPKAQRAKLKAIVKRKNAPRRKAATPSKNGKVAKADTETVLLAEVEDGMREADKLKRELRAERKKRRKLKKLLAKARSAGAPEAPAITNPPTAPPPLPDAATVGIASPSIAPLPVISGDLDIPPFPDRRDPETAFVALKAAWDNAPVAVRSRFYAEVIGKGGDFSGSQTEHP